MLPLAGALLVLVSTALGIAGPVSGAAPDSPEKTVTVAFEQSLVDADGGLVVLAVRVTDGTSGLSDMAVDFYAARDFFGKRQVNLGTAVTDATGVATLKYVPEWEGNVLITAQVKGNQEYSPANSTASLQVPRLPSPTVERESLDPLWQWALYGVGVGTVCVIALLLFLASRTVVGIAYFGRGRGPAL